jgi:hypothetical protein
MMGIIVGGASADGAKSELAESKPSPCKVDELADIARSIGEFGEEVCNESGSMLDVFNISPLGFSNVNLGSDEMCEFWSILD